MDMVCLEYYKEVLDKKKKWEKYRGEIKKMEKILAESQSHGSENRGSRIIQQIR